MAEFTVTTRRAVGSIVFDLRGDLDGSAVEQMEAARSAVAATDAGVVVLNFTELGYMNSTGIALIVAILAEARRLGTDVRVCGLSEHYRHIFEITRLADFVSFYLDEHEAVAPNPTRTNRSRSH